MRKRLLAALLVLMMLVSIMPLAVSAEEECTEHSFVQYDNYGHICESCGTYENHVDADGDCICDVCSGACHGLYGWYGPDSDEDGHWYMCENCGEIIESSEHVDEYVSTYTWVASPDDGNYYISSSYAEGQDGICEVCNYGCQHTNTAIATGGSYCYQYCTGCGVGLKDLCKDEDGDCICDVGGHELHDHNSLYADENGHGYTCGKCGEIIDYTAHTDNYTYTYTWEADSDGWSFSCNLTGCVETGDGICEFCNYGCSHTNTAVATNETTCIEYCVFCSEILQYGCTDADDDCACDICGRECHSPYYYYYSDENAHWQICSRCGEKVNYSAHVDEVATTYTYTATTVGGSYYLSEDTQTGSDGVCEVCANCPHANTAIATGGYCCFEYCTNCGGILNQYMCVDEDGDCICDIGGHEHHEYVTLYSDETGHWYACDTCGYIFGFDEHHDEYADVYSPAGLVHEEGHDGVCEYCGYGCTHPDYYRMGNTYYGEYCRCEGYCTTCGGFIGFVGVDADGDGICDTCGGIMWDSGAISTSTSGEVVSSVTVDTSALLTENDAMLIIEGYDVEIVLSVDEVTSSVSSADSALILSAAGNDVTAVSYLDIGLTKMTYDSNGDVYGQEALTDPNTTVTITVAIPQSLLDTVGTATGSYSVVRVHDGVATVLATSYDSTAKTVTFTTDRFSTYGIVFTATTDPEPTDPEPTDPEPTDPEPTDPEPTVDTGDVTTSTSGTVASSVTVDASALLTEDDAWLIASGYDVEIVLSVDEMTSSADSALILSAAGNNVVGVSYLDIDLTKMTYDTNGAVYGQEALTDLSTPVTITVAIPQSLLDSVGTTTGTYSVVRVHDGVATVLATSYDSTAKTVTFTTDRFSTYGIVFTGNTTTNNTNTELDDVPQTGDSSLILVGLALMMAAAPVVKKFVF